MARLKDGGVSVSLLRQVRTNLVTLCARRSKLEFGDILENMTENVPHNRRALINQHV